MRASWGFSLIRSSRWLACGSVLSCTLALGCGVDDRSLTLGGGGNDNSGSGGTNPQAGTSSGPLPGTAGGAPLEVPIPVCDYSQGAVPEECESLVTNAGFESTADPWVAKPGLIRTWVPEDATGAADSGSIRVVNFLHGEAEGVASGAAVQCLPARAGQVFDLAADVFIKEGQGKGLESDAYKGQARLELFFFNVPDCGGEYESGNLRNADTPAMDEVGKWVRTSGSARAPEATQSVAVRLTTIMPFREFQFEAQFDNVLVRQR